MSRNGSGTYSLPEAAFQAGTTIDQAAVNNNFSDIAAALTASIAKDGQTTPTADLPMDGFKHTNVDDATAAAHYAAWGQVQSDEANWAGTSGGSADAQTLTPTPSATAYAAGQRFRFIAGSGLTNTGACTINVSGLGAKNVKAVDGTDPDAGAITDGNVHEVVYDGTNLVLLWASTPAAFKAYLGLGTMAAEAAADYAALAAANVFTANQIVQTGAAPYWRATHTSGPSGELIATSTDVFIGSRTAHDLSVKADNGVVAKFYSGGGMTVGSGASDPGAGSIRAENDIFATDRLFVANPTSDADPAANTAAGLVVTTDPMLSINRSGGAPIRLGRSQDGDLLEAYSAGTKEGSLSISGTTFQLNGAHLARWSQWAGAKPEVRRGTVLSNRDEMCAWKQIVWTEVEPAVVRTERAPVTRVVKRTEMEVVVEDGVAIRRMAEIEEEQVVVDHVPVVDERGEKVMVDGKQLIHPVARSVEREVEVRPAVTREKRAPYDGPASPGETVAIETPFGEAEALVVAEENEQLNRVAVSDVAGDRDVAGVFVAYDESDDETYPEDFTLAQSGDFVVLIAADVKVARGDLLESAGDGTARPQADDVVRASTLAKVISTTKSHVYDDGTYLVPCVLMLG